MFWNDIKEIKKSIREIKEEIESINYNLDVLFIDRDRDREVLLAQKTLDKFDVYMKNVDKLNIMVNEVKGCVSMSRASLAGKRQNKEKNS